ncbi:hypothetical protein [Rugamonas apoptosis]|uniref:Uncharacterized protein n=1 Tax=Rugamonas apoptosis TaxID=2758570 RepID=A0A7W2FFC0_9BURK|nr:hypothetical protein [Rugamonas apoptosis]MBA5690640.1 hypothetical protein [Rugamonas apoptosis]
MVQQLYKGALNDACLELAKQVLWTNNGVSSDIVETLAARFQDEVLSHVDFIVGQNRDPNILTRAVHYLVDSHAIPPMGSDIAWFRQMLTCLVELAVPNSGLTPKGAEFLKDVQIGIEESIESADD